MPALDGSLEDLAKDLGLQVLGAVKESYGNKWDALQAMAKEMFEETTEDAGRLAVKKLRGQDVSKELLHIEAQLANLKVVGGILAVQTFWSSFEKVMTVIGTSLGVVAKAALKAITGLSL